MEVLEALFAKALRLESPWKITKVEFHEGEGVIKVVVDFPKGSVFCCPVCGKEVNFFQYACYLTVRVPRTDCPADGIIQIDVPWAREGRKRVGSPVGIIGDSPRPTSGFASKTIVVRHDWFL